MIKTLHRENNSNNKTFNNPVLIARTNARDLSPKASRKWQTQSLINAADFGQRTLKKWQTHTIYTPLILGMNIKETANPKLYLIYTTDFGQWALKETANPNYIIYTTDFGQWTLKKQQTQTIYKYTADSKPKTIYMPLISIHTCQKNSTSNFYTFHWIHLWRPKETANLASKNAVAVNPWTLMKRQQPNFQQGDLQPLPRGDHSLHAWRLCWRRAVRVHRCAAERAEAIAAPLLWHVWLLGCRGNSTKYIKHI